MFLVETKSCCLLVFVVTVCTLSRTFATDKRCYACNSYMAQCQHHTLSTGTSNVFQARCTSKCFTRQGEDNAIYRGCFDAFKAVKQLSDGYIGCRNQTWNNRVRRWCLCDSDLCNFHDIGNGQNENRRFSQQQQQQHQQHHQLEQPQPYRVAGSGSNSVVTTLPTTHHYPSPSQQLPTSDSVDQLRSDRQQNATSGTSSRAVEPIYPPQPNTDEYRTVWNNWLVDQGPGAVANDHAYPTTTQATRDQLVSYDSGTDRNGGWVDAQSRGVLHSVHRDQQPASRNYGEQVLYREPRPERGSYRGEQRDYDSMQPGVAKSAWLKAEQHGGVEPISNSNLRSRSSAASAEQLEAADVNETARSKRGEMTDELSSNAGSSGESREVGSERTAKFYRDSTKQRQRHHQLSVDSDEIENSPRHQTSTTNEQKEDVQLDNEDETGEILEYPYNQEFIGHPVDWTPVEYFPEIETIDDSLPLVGVAQEPDVTDKADALDNKDYPYNQYKEPEMGEDNNDDEGNKPAEIEPIEPSETRVSLKEGGSSPDAEEQSEEMAREMTTPVLDYPYNQLMTLDEFADLDNGARNHLEAPSVVNSTVSGSQRKETVKYTVHSDSRTSSLPSSVRRHRDSSYSNHDELMTTSRSNDESRELLVPTTASSSNDDRRHDTGSMNSRLDQVVVQHPHQIQQHHYERHPIHERSNVADRRVTVTNAPAQQQRPTEIDAVHQSNDDDVAVSRVVEIPHGEPTMHHRSPSFDSLRRVFHDDVSTSHHHGDDAVVEIVPLKLKDEIRGGGNFQHHYDHYRRHGFENEMGPPGKEANDEEGEFEKMDDIVQFNSQTLGHAPQIRCSQTGYYQNPKDCTQFVACLFDHNIRTKVLHLMRCPSGLVWDNHHKLCMEASSTCREALSQADLDSNYLQFLSASSPAVQYGVVDRHPVLDPIKNKHVIYDQ